MAEIENGEQLIDNLRPLIEDAANKAWVYAQMVGWDKDYPLLSHDMTEPLTRDSILKTYESITRQMYRAMIKHLNEADALPPAGKVIILWCNYADFTGAVLVYPDRNPAFKFGVLW